jgi:acyl carrier protein
MYLKEEIINLVAKLFGISSDEIYMESHLLKDLGLDSLDIVEVTIECEEKFNILISDSDVEKINYVGDIYQIVNGKALQLNRQQAS